MNLITQTRLSNSNFKKLNNSGSSVIVKDGNKPLPSYDDFMAQTVRLNVYIYFSCIYI